MVGAKTELQRLSKHLMKPDDGFLPYLSSENIDWKFISPKSRLFEDLCVKSIKHHPIKAVAKTKFNFEEYETIIMQLNFEF